VDGLSGTGFDIYMMMLNVTERICVRNVVLIISKRKFHISFIQLIVLSKFTSSVEVPQYSSRAALGPP
jgi:hypothetical protein